MQPTREQALVMYENMLTSRAFEAAIAKAYLEGKQPVFNMAKGPLPGEMHLCDGQEPPAVGLSIHLRPDDHLVAGHRPHGHALAKGVDIRAMAAEIFGKKAGLSGGRGGHMHLFDATNSFWTAGIIGQAVAPAVGATLAFKMQQRDAVAVAVLGEGGANAGGFHEGLNLAALWKLPFILIIEDNGWAVSVPKSASTSVPYNHVRAGSYGIPGVHVADNDPEAIFAACGEAIQRARSGGGPTLIEIETLRIAGHFQGDTEQYRPAAERSSKEARDPIPRYRDVLLARGWLHQDSDDALRSKAQARVDDAMQFARDAAYPAPAEALEHVFS